MRKIKFRAREIKRGEKIGEWRYGYYQFSGFQHIIHEEDGPIRRSYYVDEDTVGQYTALKDKNGKEIYEGDFVSYRHLEDEGVATVEFLDGSFSLDRIPLCNLYESSLGVIGNVFETPSLLTSRDKQ